MKDPGYWRSHYVLDADPEEIARRITLTTFDSAGERLELVTFENGGDSPSILISQGTAGHPYVFAELAYFMHARGYNVFIMPRHGSRPIGELVDRHRDALAGIASRFNSRVGVFAEGLGGYAAFYLALAHGPLTSIVCQNSPAILTEPAYHRAVLEERGAARGARRVLPLLRFLARIAPGLTLPIPLYLDFRELIDTEEPNRRVETRLVVDGYLRDPDFDRSYTLSAIMSLLDTPPPNPLEDLRIPTMFLAPSRGVWPDYTRELFGRLPAIEKRIVEVDGSVFWMVSHPRDAADAICSWFDETVAPAGVARVPGNDLLSARPGGARHGSPA